VSQDFDAAEERARLAAADLLAAASHVVAWHSMRPEDARDDVDFASRARTEIGSISAALSASAARPGENAVAVEAEVIGRLDVLAADCERRAVALRS